MTRPSLSPGPGGRCFVRRKSQRGPVGPRAVCGREIQEGGLRPLSGGTAEFLPVKHIDSSPLL